MNFAIGEIIIIVLILDLIYIAYTKFKTNKINPIALIAAVPLAIISFFFIGLSTPLLLLSIIIIILGIYALTLTKRYVDAKIQASKISLDMNAKIDLLKESIDRVETKVDKIDKILEKVSE